MSNNLMKKVTAFLLVCCLLSQTVETMRVFAQTNTDIRNDVNEDGSFNVADLVRLKKHLSGICDFKDSADINDDKEVNAVDLLKMRCEFLGTEFNCESFDTAVHFEEPSESFRYLFTSVGSVSDEISLQRVKYSEDGKNFDSKYGDYGLKGCVDGKTKFTINYAKAYETGNILSFDIYVDSSVQQKVVIKSFKNIKNRVGNSTFAAENDCNNWIHIETELATDSASSVFSLESEDTDSINAIYLDNIVIGNEASIDVSYGEVWSAPSTVKIYEDDIDYASKGEASLNFNAVKNEYESRQLLITADSTISQFYLQTADLYCGDNILSSECIDVYYEKYSYIDDKYYGTGAIPDALIPLDHAKEYGELTIESGRNGAFWITVKVPEDIEAGVYMGSFALVVNEGETLTIPVTVKVNEYVLDTDNVPNTLFTWRYADIALSEGYTDSTKHNNTDPGYMEMIENYRDFFLEYDISLQTLPISELSGANMVKALETKMSDGRTYFDHITSFTVNTNVGGTTTGDALLNGHLEDQVLTLAAASTPEVNYLSKLMIYFIDEPDLTDSGIYATVLEKLKTLNEQLQSFVTIIEKDTTGTYDNFRSIENWQSYILNIPNIIPANGLALEYLFANEDDEILDYINCLCFGYDRFRDDKREQIISFCRRNDISVWWYGCMGPANPAPTYHIGDSNLLSSRSVSWLQQMYDCVEGNLYWNVAGCESETDDLYESPYRGTYPAGDGFIAYPGSDYGVSGPIPSMRLMSIRDGMEEYIMLTDLENQYVALADVYGEEFSAKESMSHFYENLYYNGIYMNEDDKISLDFDSLRAELIDAVSNADTGFVLDDITYLSENSVTVEYYLHEDYSVIIDGIVQTPNASGSYSYTISDLNTTNSIRFVLVDKEGNETVLTRFISAPEQYTYTDGNGQETVVLNNHCNKQTVSYTFNQPVTKGQMVRMEVEVKSSKATVKLLGPTIWGGTKTYYSTTLTNPTEPLVFSAQVDNRNLNNFTVEITYEDENGDYSRNSCRISNVSVFDYKESVTVHSAGNVTILNSDAAGSVKYVYNTPMQAGSTLTFDIDFNVNEELRIWVLADGKWNNDTDTTNEFYARMYEYWSGKTTISVPITKDVEFVTIFIIYAENANDCLKQADITNLCVETEIGTYSLRNPSGVSSVEYDFKAPDSDYQVVSFDIDFNTTEKLSIWVLANGKWNNDENGYNNELYAKAYASWSGSQTISLNLGKDVEYYTVYVLYLGDEENRANNICTIKNCSAVSISDMVYHKTMSYNGDDWNFDLDLNYPIPEGATVSFDVAVPSGVVFNCWTFSYLMEKGEVSKDTYYNGYGYKEILFHGDETLTIDSNKFRIKVRIMSEDTTNADIIIKNIKIVNPSTSE